MKRPLPSELLQTLVVVVKAGRFDAAAAQLGVSGPRVSQQMKELEQLVGAPLFSWQGRVKVLTQAGQVVYAHANTIMTCHDEMNRVLSKVIQAEDDCLDA